MNRILVLAPMLLTACATTASHAIEGPVTIGRTAQVGGLRVRPDAIVEDSRCPMNARCVWASRVVLNATVSGGGWSKRVALTLGEPVQITDGTLTLTSVTPERMAGTQAKRPPSRFAFDFQGGL